MANLQSSIELIVGIDPGYHGAISIFHEGILQEIWDMPLKQGKTKKVLDLQMLGFMFNNLDKRTHIKVAFIEQVSAMPGQGVTSMFNFGYQVGALHMLLVSRGWVIHKVAPQKWKKHFGLLKTEKDAARLYAQDYWPKQKEFFKRKKDGGRADAALIGEAGRRIVPQYIGFNEL